MAPSGPPLCCQQLFWASGRPHQQNQQNLLDPQPDHQPALTCLLKGAWAAQGAFFSRADSPDGGRGQKIQKKNQLSPSPPKKTKLPADGAV